MVSENFNKNFITEIIDSDLSKNSGSNIHTRFPPEPNGFLHIGYMVLPMEDFP